MKDDALVLVFPQLSSYIEVAESEELNEALALIVNLCDALFRNSKPQLRCLSLISEVVENGLRRRKLAGTLFLPRRPTSFPVGEIRDSVYETLMTKLPRWMWYSGSKNSANLRVQILSKAELDLRKCPSRSASRLCTPCCD